ncbi:hypothetical protein M427DRAFT_55778 [Gonapodya prolifera JEL478]|uniref:SH3 domain-containing protein n=1 Tax=Gonapodya prolifera (strain JEL478) TaxID=1344416 RepID=A0A139AHT3_GONPJ|nr:hypothetical protein M427DRAFT_55778 [Gonapodya prolifera JEL478]|eukprot:KXS16357.1 hypothetical protein M427DRAFT_55778 [Gonapodya prolifera JEL478]
MAASTAQSAVAYVLRTHTADFDDHTDALTVGGTSSVEYARTESPDLAEEPVEETDLHPGLGESLAAPTLARASRALTPDLISFDETGGVDFKVDDDQGLPPSPSAPPEAFTRAVIEAEEGRASLLTTSIDESGQDHVPQINDVQRTEPPSTSRAIPVGEARLPSENDWMSALSPAPSPSRGATSTPPSSEVEDLRQQLSLVRDVLKRERAEADVRERRHELEVANLRREVDSLRDGAKVRESEHARQVDELLYGFDQQSQGERAKIAERQQSEMEDMRATSRQLNMAYEKMNAEHEWEKERIREDAVKQQQAFKRREAELQQEAARLKPILQAQLEAHKKNQEEQQRKIAELQKKVDGRTAALQQRESEHQKVINELQRAVQGQRYEFETRISELTSTVEFFEHQLTEKEARISTTDRDVGHLRSRIAQLDDEGFEKGVRIAFFQQELKERDRQITALTQKALAASSRGIAGAPGDNRNGTGTRGVHKKNVVNQVLYAVQSFQPQRPDEIPLRVGDAVLRMFAFEDGWSAGLNKSGVQSGFFPSSCLSPDQPLGSHAPHPTGKVPTRSSSLGEIVANGVAH